MSKSNSRIPPLALSLLAASANLAVAAQLLSLSRDFKWESDNEWEGYPIAWRIDGVKITWALMIAYFTTAFVACVVGFIGVVKVGSNFRVPVSHHTFTYISRAQRIPSYVRLYRDYSVADLCFNALCTVLLAFASFRPSLRSAVCSEVSQQPELLQGLAEAGLNLENCEQWFEHAVVAVVGATAVLLVIRLQFILVVSNYYKHLVRHQNYNSMELCESPVDDDAPQRIYLLPSRSSMSMSTPNSSASHHRTTANSHSRSRSSSLSNVFIYAPVPLNSLSEEEARDLKATEAWVSRKEHKSHSRSLSYSSSHSSSNVQYGALHRHSGQCTDGVLLSLYSDEGVAHGKSLYEA
ncbi:hypothetical protein BD410DRAFT_798178 [Rickenella mellea]|uniref:Uncharacterized protein n=1 Tax=Rickenella mellea TaxID=50990 RepID=A0A4R5XER9_9AGAM|nr:hypothetical protein BD410DRAFT_798178 [Rickenella mellea]